LLPHENCKGWAPIDFFHIEPRGRSCYRSLS